MLKRLIIAAFTLAGAPAATAQTAVPSDIRSAPFGTCSSAVPTHVSSATVSAILAEKQRSKSQFETSADYEKRITPIVAKLFPVRLVFSLSPDAGKYDAESEILLIPPDSIAHEIMWLDNFNFPDAGKFWFGALVGGKVSTVSHYKAQNIYGRTMNVTKFDRTQIMYIFPGDDQFRQTNHAMRIAIPRAAAKAHVHALKIVIEGEATAPYFFEDTRQHSPDIHDRVDITTKLVGIMVAPKCGTIVDSLTGKIVDTFNPSTLSRHYSP